MTDIVERLRGLVYHEEWLEEAADEIDRLRAENERLRHYRDVVQRCVGADKEIRRLRAEVAELTAQVELLRRGHVASTVISEQLRAAIARRALGDET